MAAREATNCSSSEEENMLCLQQKCYAVIYVCMLYAVCNNISLSCRNKRNAKSSHTPRSKRSRSKPTKRERKRRPASIQQDAQNLTNTVYTRR
jgi:hypothetical protein